MSTTGEAGGAEQDLMLGAVGVSAEAERAYLHLLERPGSALRDVAAAIELPVRKTTAVLSELETMGLLTRSPGETPRYAPAPPETAVEVLVLKRLEALDRTRLAIPRLAHAARDGTGPSGAEEVVRVFTGRDAAVQHFNQIHLGARREVLVFDRPPYIVPSTDNDVEAEQLRKGVRFRVIYDEEALAHPDQLKAIMRFVAMGEEARVVQSLPGKAIMADGQLGLIPLDIGDPASGCVSLRSSALLEILITFFETVWATAAPLRVTGGLGVASEARPLSAESESIASLLAAGLKDDTIARQIGISPRTLDRRIQEIMQTLGARTRFQAGVLATEALWRRAE
jgi:sugar-specific transcriptional regulator TrmB/DNA-binding CsgD family transcriptional regulator